MNPHFRALTPAYQLHSYFCFKTHYLQPLLASRPAQSLVRDVLIDVCDREEYNLLETAVADDHLRVLLSLQPMQAVARVAKMLKGNIDREFSLAFQHESRFRKLFARGYFARSSGKVNLEAARHYVETQAAHHGYRGEWVKPLTYRNSNFRSPAFPLTHSYCLLNYHLVLATQNRISLFDEMIAPRLFKYAICVGEKHGFAIERMGLMPDHFHLLIEARSDVAIEECARALIENTRWWMERSYWGVLKETDGWDVWQPSYYAGTVGEYTTPQVERFLRSGDSSL